MTWKQDKKKLEKFMQVYDYRRIKLADEKQEKNPDKIKLKQHNSVSNVALRQAVKFAEEMKQKLKNPVYFENNQKIKTELLRFFAKIKGLELIHAQKTGRSKIKSIRQKQKIGLKRFKEIRKIKKTHGLFPHSLKDKKPQRRTRIIIKFPK